MIAFKVVEKKTRWCSNWAYFKHYAKDTLPEVYKCGLRYKKQHPKFFPRYLKGRMIEGAPGTVGIYVFPTRSSAERFKGRLPCEDQTKVIKVEGIGTSQKVESVIEACGTDPWYLTYKPWLTRPAPKDTIAFKAVKVLE